MTDTTVAKPVEPARTPRVAELEAAVQRAHDLATRLEKFAENALRVDDSELYAAIAKDLRERLKVPAASEARP